MASVTKQAIVERLTDAVLKLVGQVPASNVPPGTLATEQSARAEAIAAAACKKAATISAGLALPAGPWGMATVLPDLMLIWQLQARMVADIAAVYGRSAELGREHMLWCLFKHSSAQALRDFAVRSGERWLIRKAGTAAIQAAAKAIGIRLSQQMVGKSAARFVPLLGAAGVGVYAYRDTRAVAKAAIALFEGAGGAPADLDAPAPD